MVAGTIGRAGTRRATFHVWMAAIFVLIAFSGFAETYWMQLPAGTFTGRPLLHLHGILFSAWTLFYLSQTVMVATRRMEHHRAWGVAGVSLATALVFVGLATAIASMNKDIALGQGRMAMAFSIVPITSIILFGALIAWAVVTVKQPEVHKRLMLLATLSILQAPLGRFFFLAIVGGGPGARPGSHPPAPAITTLPPAIVSVFLVAALAINDWRTRGRAHPITVWVGLGVIASELVRIPLSTTPQWLAVAGAFSSFGTY